MSFHSHVQKRSLTNTMFLEMASTQQPKQNEMVNLWNLRRHFRDFSEGIEDGIVRYQALVHECKEKLKQNIEDDFCSSSLKEELVNLQKLVSELEEMVPKLPDKSHFDDLKIRELEHDVRTLELQAQDCF
ncbi:hypothetical protein QAD02_000955 [Eretmocerus hayati]|uniref:Uncharacterized protein n=1 Tax=Eretmocerus hayati TaxID=131215 RepID=A0ACC2NF24_9HYME|nr:hypothetical protein QAD02_000955 [Eretmocerus hayati]